MRRAALVAFIVLELAHRLIESLRTPISEIEKFDPDLARQLRRAATSVPLNLDEGNGRRGRDRLQFWRVATGSAREVVSALRVARSWGYLSQATIAPPLALCDQLLAILWKLTR